MRIFNGFLIIFFFFLIILLGENSVSAALVRARVVIIRDSRSYARQVPFADRPEHRLTPDGSSLKRQFILFYPSICFGYSFWKHDV